MLTTHAGQTDDEMVDNFRMWWNDRYYMNKPSSVVFEILRNYVRNMRKRDRWRK